MKIPSSPCVLFVESEELVALSRTFVTRWMWNGEGLVQLTQAKHQHYEVDSNTAPVVDLVNRLVMISQDGSCSWVNFDGDNRGELSR